MKYIPIIPIIFVFLFIISPAISNENQLQNDSIQPKLEKEIHRLEDEIFKLKNVFNSSTEKIKILEQESCECE